MLHRDPNYRDLSERLTTACDQSIYRVLEFDRAVFTVLVKMRCCGAHAVQAVSGFSGLVGTVGWTSTLD